MPKTKKRKMTKEELAWSKNPWKEKKPKFDNGLNGETLETEKRKMTKGKDDAPWTLDAKTRAAVKRAFRGTLLGDDRPKKKKPKKKKKLKDWAERP